MYGKVKIGNKEIEMVANGATPYRFKQLFHEDLLRLAVKSGDEIDNVNLFIQAGFIMAKQAEKADFSTLNIEDFYNWLEEFEANDVAMAAGDIANIYAGNAETSENPKPKAARRSGR